MIRISRTFHSLAAMCILSVAAPAPAAVNLDVMVGGLSNTAAALEQRSVNVSGTAARRAIMEALLRTADPAARLLSATEIQHQQQELSGLDYALPVRLSMSNGMPVIVSAPAGSNLPAGAIIQSVDGKPLAPAAITEILDRTRAHTNVTLALGLRLPGGETNLVETTLALVRLPSIETADVLPVGLGYIKFNGLFEQAADDLANQLRAWQTNKLYGVVLDLRGAHGESLAAAGRVASYFAPPGAHLYSMRSATDQDLEVVKAEGAERFALTVMVLADGRSRGAAEVLAAILGGSVKGAMVLGQSTQGDPLIREIIPLGSDEFAYVATRRLVTADGTSCDGRQGVKPDILISAQAGASSYEPGVAEMKRITLDEEIADRALRARVRGDAVLQRAVDILIGLKALNIKGLAPPEVPEG